MSSRSVCPVSSGSAVRETAGEPHSASARHHFIGERHVQQTVVPLWGAHAAHFSGDGHVVRLGRAGRRLFRRLRNGAPDMLRRPYLHHLLRWIRHKLEARPAGGGPGRMDGIAGCGDHGCADRAVLFLVAELRPVAGHAYRSGDLVHGRGLGIRHSAFPQAEPQGRAGFAPGGGEREQRPHGLYADADCPASDGTRRRYPSGTYDRAPGGSGAGTGGAAGTGHFGSAAPGGAGD